MSEGLLPKSRSAARPGPEIFEGKSEDYKLGFVDGYKEGFEDGMASWPNEDFIAEDDQ